MKKEDSFLFFFNIPTSEDHVPYSVLHIKLNRSVTETLEALCQSIFRKFKVAAENWNIKTLKSIQRCLNSLVAYTLLTFAAKSFVKGHAHLDRQIKKVPNF